MPGKSESRDKSVSGSLSSSSDLGIFDPVGHLVAVLRRRNIEITQEVAQAIIDDFNEHDYRLVHIPGPPPRFQRWGMSNG